GYEINEKCRNKSDDVEYSDDMIIETDSYAGLDHNQEAGFERNHEPNRGDVDFKDEIMGV
ncbi:20771_t:CDS:2, partial [Gigaspora rosea]